MRRVRPLPPGLLAQQDHDQALLADLVGRARRHHKYCARPATCPGDAVEALLEEVHPDAPYRVLLLAVAELAAAGRDEPVETFVDPRPGHPRGRRA